MTRLKIIRSPSMPALYSRIRYETALEALGFRRLAELDTEGARAAFGRLVEQLDLGVIEGREREIVLLLLDVLQRVNRRLHRPPDDDPSYQHSRVVLLEAFASLETAEAARRAFMPALNRLLAPLLGHPASAHPLIERTKSFLEDHHHKRIGLSAVAIRLNVSANYLSRLFRKETGTTLTAYLHRVRLEHARLLLAAGDRSISEIAYLVGYQTYRDFYRNFVKYERSSPRQAKLRYDAVAADAANPRPPGVEPR